MANNLQHKFISAKNQSPDPTLVSKNEWNDEHLFAGGSDGAVLSYLDSASDNAAWITQPAFFAANSPVFNVKLPPYSAVGDGVTNDTAAIQSAINAMTTGGVLYFPKGTYKVSKVASYDTCLWVKYDNITIQGQGRSSVIKSTNNLDTILQISKSEDPTVFAPGTNINNIVVRDITIQGTGTFQNSPLGGGRGIHGIRCANLMVRDCFLLDMSMIGADTLDNAGYVTYTGNVCHNNAITALNFNGQAAQGVIANNVCSGCLGSVNAVIIQVTGNCIVANNTLYDSAGFGILHGEGNYDGLTIIANNFIKKTVQAGIQGLYHGPTQIIGNTVVNSSGGTAGITLSGATDIFPVPVHNSMIHNNRIINCAPVGIYTSSPRTSIVGNSIIRMTGLVNSGNAILDIDAAADYTRGITVQGENCFVSQNVINGAVHGIGIFNAIIATLLGLNQFLNISTNEISAINNAGVVNASTRAGVTIGGRVTEGGSAAPLNGPVRLTNWEVFNTSPASGNPKSWLNIAHLTTNTTAISSASTTLTHAAISPAPLAGDTVMVVNGQTDWTAQYRVVASVTDTTHVVLTAAITCGSGEIVYFDRFVSTGNL